MYLHVSVFCVETKRSMFPSNITVNAFGLPSEMTPTDYEAFLAEHEEGNKDIKLPCPTLEKVINKLKLPAMKEK